MSKRGVEKKNSSRDRQFPASGRRRFLLAAGAAILGTGGFGAISLWQGGSGKSSRAYALAPESALPTKIREAPPSVREAYRFAIANRDILKQIPCYCGCGAEHPSNAECYIKEVKPNGEIVFDPMSFG